MISKSHISVEFVKKKYEKNTGLGCMLIDFVFNGRVCKKKDTLLQTGICFFFCYNCLVSYQSTTRFYSKFLFIIIDNHLLLTTTVLLRLSIILEALILADVVVDGGLPTSSGST